MNKGIIMEQHRKYAIIMTREGTFHKAIPIKDAIIGTEVSYEPLKSKKGFVFLSSKKMNIPVRLFSMACILLLFVLPFYFIMTNNKIYAYVNIDINPSIELEINEELLVQSVRPLNDDATAIIRQLADYEHQKLENVIEMIMNKSEETGLINDRKNMLVGVSYVTNKSERISVIDDLERYFLNSNSDWEIATFNVPKDVREKAEESNKSMNEVMATEIEEEAMEKDSKNDTSMNDEEEAIINSFYTDNENHSESENELKIEEKTQENNDNSSHDVPVKKEKPSSSKSNNNLSNDNKHPSELKGKNGEINSNGKNKATSGNNKKKEKRDNNGKNPHEKKQKNNKGKSKDNKHKNNGKGNDNKHKNNGNKGNNGKGNNNNNSHR